MSRALLILLLLPLFAQGQSELEQNRLSHIAANVPAKADFDRFLQRDLEQHFEVSLGGHKKLKYELLRDGPTQSGVSYPKFYAWVEIIGGTDPKSSGAVRIAAIDREYFQVTDFVSNEDIKNNPEQLDAVFPVALIPAIVERMPAD